MPQALWYMRAADRPKSGRKRLRRRAPDEVRVRRALRRAQPRHRGAGAWPDGCRRANSSACARRSWPAIFRFRSNTATPRSAEIEDGPEDLRGRTVFTLHPHQSLFNIPASAAVIAARQPAAATRRAGRQHGDRAQRGLGCGAGPGRPHRHRRRRRGRLAGRLSVRAASRRRRDARRYQPRARGISASSSVLALRRPKRQRAIATSSFTPAATRPDSARPSRSPARRQPCSN